LKLEKQDVVLFLHCKHTQALVMQIPVISVGNSKGIRLNKMLLQKYNIGDVVELVMEADHIILRPVKKPREGWDEAFKAMHKNGDDALLVPDVFEEENFDN
jgi:antitoxin MazE